MKTGKAFLIMVPMLVAATAALAQSGKQMIIHKNDSTTTSHDTRALNPQPIPPGKFNELNPQPIPPGKLHELNPQPIPPGKTQALNPQPIPPGIEINNPPKTKKKKQKKKLE
jgi:hypothetical protein